MKNSYIWFILMILCLLTGSDVLLVTAAVITAVLIVMCFAGRKEIGKETEKCQKLRKLFCR